MPSQLYIHKRDGVSLKRMTRTPGNQAWCNASYALRVGTGDDDGYGITIDGDPATGHGGMNLWVCTESQAAAATTPGLVKIPLADCNGVTITPVRVFQTQLPVGAILQDIVWNGEGFFAVVGGVGASSWLIKMGVNGDNITQLSTSLPTTTRAVAFDGKTIYVTWTVGGGAIGVTGVFTTRGTLYWSYLMALPNAPGSQAPGIVWNGCQLALKVVRNPIDFMLADVPTMRDQAGVAVIKTEQTATPQPAIDYEQAPLAWDGAFYWSLSSEDVLGGGG